MAFSAMPLLGPSFAGRSKRTTGTRQFTRWAAICAPITPAPRTATLRTGNRFMSGIPYSMRIQVCVRPSMGMPTKPRTSSFLPPSAGVRRTL